MTKLKDNSPDNNLENSKLRFEVDALMEEYRSTRAEVNVHLSNEHQIINLTVTLLVGTVAAIQLLSSTNSSNFLGPLLLIASLLFTSINFMHLGENIFISQSSKYIQQVLRPRMEKVIFQATGEKQKIWEWAEYYTKDEFSSFGVIPAIFISASRLALSILPSIGTLIFYFSQMQQRASISPWENILLVFAIVAAVMMVITIIFTLSSFSSIYKPSRKPSIR
jgi:hypothetical protein